MQENGKIASRQFMILVTIYTLGSSVLTLPKYLAEEAKQDAWLTAMLMLSLGLSLVWLYKALGNLYPNMTLVEYSQEILGKWLGKIISLLFFAYSFLLCSLLLRQISDFFTSTMMVETPIESIHLLFLFAVAIGVRYGVENIARASEVFFPWVLILFLLTIAFLLPQIKFENIQPIFEKGVKPILGTSIMQLGFPYLELVLFLMVYPFVSRWKEAGNSFFIGTVLGGLGLILIMLLSVLVLGAEETANQHFPSYILAQKIDVGNFIQRVEAIMAGLWVFTIYFKLKICYYISALILAQTFEIRDYRPLVFPMAMILFILAVVIAPDINYFGTFKETIWTPFSLMFGFLIPLLLFIVAKIRNK